MQVEPARHNWNRSFQRKVHNRWSRRIYEKKWYFSPYFHYESFFQSISLLLPTCLCVSLTRAGSIFFLIFFWKLVKSTLLCWSRCWKFNFNPPYRTVAPSYSNREPLFRNSGNPPLKWILFQPSVASIRHQASQSSIEAGFMHHEANIMRQTK